jgi:hypothetical protein
VAGPPKTLTEPDRDVVRVLVTYVCEHRRQQRVLVDVPVEDLGEPFYRGASPVIRRLSSS